MLALEAIAAAWTGYASSTAKMDALVREGMSAIDDRVCFGRADGGVLR
jgi:hypothetical protein